MSFMNLQDFLKALVKYDVFPFLYMHNETKTHK